MFSRPRINLVVPPRLSLHFSSPPLKCQTQRCVLQPAMDLLLLLAGSSFIPALNYPKRQPGCVWLCGSASCWEFLLSSTTFNPLFFSSSSSMNSLLPLFPAPGLQEASRMPCFHSTAFLLEQAVAIETQVPFAPWLCSITNTNCAANPGAFFFNDLKETKLLTSCTPTGCPVVCPGQIK